MEEKYELQNEYLETIHLAEEKGCTDARFLKELHTAYETLLKEDKQHIEHYITKYSILQNDYINKILNDC